VHRKKQILAEQVSHSARHQKLGFGALKEAFLASEWNYFHFTGKESDYLHLNHTLNYECASYLNYLWHTITTENHRWNWQVVDYPNP